MFDSVKYEKESFKKNLLGREYTIINLIPSLRPEEKKQAENEIKTRLFHIFKKYV